MKWPLVWREDYDEAVRIIHRLELNVSEARAQATTMLQALERNIALIERLADDLAHSFRPVTPTNPLASVPLPVPVRDEIQDAIELSAGYDKSLSRHLTRWAKQQKIDGMKEHDIINSIIHWRNANEWDGNESDTPSFL